MCKSKVQPFVSTISRSGKIMVFLLSRHCIPLGRSLLVGPHVKDLRSHHDDDVVTRNGDEDLVSAEVVGRVVGTIDLLESA